MSSNNNDNSGIAIGLAVIGAGMIVMALLLYAVAVFAAIILSVLCFCAWNDDLTLGSWTLTPGEARAFVRRGLIGAGLTPVFLQFCEVLFGVRINADYLIHLMLGGYAAGSIGIELMRANEAGPDIPAPRLPAPPPAQIAPPKSFIPSQPQPFRFASWDDEDERP